ncbi:MAG TPA: outer membrane beta-barrel protein [Candidatus Sulfotelmatobacter sp.]|nr:outer membrane beta-barrel protein [Candidatus Sulfotelmatobacter sp.]
MKVLIRFLFLFIPLSAVAQQDYVPRVDAFTGFSYLNSPKLNLAERGFNAELGVNVNRWLALGGDYSIFTGHSDITVPDLKPSLQLQLAPLLSLLPPGTVLALPFDSTTYTFSAGPQINFRQLKWVTFFIRPALGGMHETATLKASTPVLALLVQRLAPSGKKTDIELFYGVGGGFDINASKHVALRVGFDYVHVNLFSDVLAEGRNTLRMSVGPTFRFGSNVP